MTNKLKSFWTRRSNCMIFLLIQSVTYFGVATFLSITTTNAFVLPSPTTRARARARARTRTTTSSALTRVSVRNTTLGFISTRNNNKKVNDDDITTCRVGSQIDASSTLTSSSSSSSLSLSSDQKSILSVGIWCLLDIGFRRVFQRLGIAGKFPSSLGGCGVVLAILLLIPSMSGKDTNDGKNKLVGLHSVLSPGAALLAKWLPLFFVPSLVTLPLVGGIESLGGSIEILKIFAVIVGGFYFTLLTTAGSVIAVGRLMRKKENVDDDDDEVYNKRNNDNKINAPSDDDVGKKVGLVAALEVATTAMPEAPVLDSMPFSDHLMKNLRIVAIISGLAALEAVSPMFSTTTPPAKLLTKLKTPILTLLLGSTTLSGFVYGSRLPKKTKKIIHPLVTCLTITWTVMVLFAKCTERTFIDMLSSIRWDKDFKCTERTFINMLSSYKMGQGFHGLNGTGAGDILLFLLGPAVMSLSISMYDKRDLIRDNFFQILSAVSVSSIGGLFGTAWMVRLMGLVKPSLRSPLAMAIAGLLGASAPTVSIAVSMVVVTGLFGANFGAASLTKAGIKDPVARGMGIGAAAHGLGTAAFVDEKDAFPFAAISMALTATAVTCLISVPPIKKLVLQIALNGVL
eukprot:CAMPEP_0170983628 /NCGR_PEP_ID=MMETSP0736-20130129/4361_1 /TAXON_ID=186038 /ORGANISM="Fragilariopsis kerguelensis, Strain L26-C5" /LENGTH=626 /DNA_ID=CAMNT_0011407131 /DNA_START=77 /DNA_END=1958 /DNA_ORIENTATION=+